MRPRRTMAGRSWPLWLGVGATALIGATAWWAAGTGGSAPAPVTRAAIPAEQDCSRYLRCAAQKAVREASLHCRLPIEQLAAFSAQWTEPGADSIFHDYNWLDERKGTITYLGNKVHFQNAGGAKMPVAYECDFDPATSQVLDARARVGAPSS